MTAKDNGGACFPLDFGITPTKGRQPSHPHRSGFFCSFHATCVPTCEWLATTDPPRLIALAAAGSKRRFGLRLSLAWSCPRYAISDGGFTATPPYFLFFSIPPGSISPGTIPAHQSSAIKRAVQKNATLQKSGVRYFSA
ncbi:MAG: hypothetical protein PUE05_07745 [bacterium]|nr:hypothetical protein [bacterium]